MSLEGLESNVLSEIKIALDGVDSPFKLIKCPKCGYDYSHIDIHYLKPEETETKQGGYLVELTFECDHPNVAYIFAEHKGKVVYGKMRENRKYMISKDE